MFQVNGKQYLSVNLTYHFHAQHVDFPKTKTAHPSEPLLLKFSRVQISERIKKGDGILSLKVM